jgi:hypothetical protein
MSKLRRTAGRTETTTALPTTGTAGSNRSRWPRRRFGARLGVVGSVAALMVMLFAGAASADTFNWNLHYTNYTWKDCTINVGFVQDTHDGARWGAIAGSRMSCASPHSIYVQQTLTFNGVQQPGASAVLHYSSYGWNGTLETQARCGVGTWGSVTKMSLDGSVWYAMPNVPQFVATGC